MILSPCTSSRLSVSGWVTQTGRLPIAQIMIWHHIDFRGANRFRIRGILPIHMNIPEVNPIVFEHLFNCVPPAAIMILGASCGGSSWPSMSALSENSRHPSRCTARLLQADQQALLVRSANVTLLLNHIVTSCWYHKVAVDPNRGPRIVRKQSALECVAVIHTEQLRAGADRVGTRSHSLLSFLAGVARARRRRRRRRRKLSGGAAAAPGDDACPALASCPGGTGSPGCSPALAGKSFGPMQKKSA